MKLQIPGGFKASNDFVIKKKSLELSIESEDSGMESYPHCVSHILVGDVSPSLLVYENINHVSFRNHVSLPLLNTLRELRELCGLNIPQSLPQAL